MRAKRRDRDESFHSFFVAEGERLRRLGIFLTGDPDRAADLAQETLARTYRHWNRIHDADPGPYARRVLVNLVRSAHRRSLLERKHVQPSPQITDRKAPHVDEYLHITKALKELPPVRRATIYPDHLFHLSMEYSD
jgi:DNA-directed RNA polymerase specialized sigma24 family protein